MLILLLEICLIVNSLYNPSRVIFEILNIELGYFTSKFVDKIIGFSVLKLINKDFVFELYWARVTSTNGYSTAKTSGSQLINFP